MKSILSAVSAVLMSFVVYQANSQEQSTPTSGGSGGGGPSSLPIRSRGVLKAYAEKEVAQGLVFVHSPSELPGGKNNVSAPPAPGRGLKEVLNILNNASLDFAVSDVHDTVNVGGVLWNHDGYPSFEVQKQTRLQFYSERGTFWLPPNENLQFQLSSEVPIYYKGAQDVVAVVRNKTGEIITRRGIEAKNDYIFFPTNLLGRVGEVNVSFRKPDGVIGSASYNLSDGFAHPIDKVRGYLPVGIANDFNFGQNPPNVSVNGWDFRDVVVHFEVTGAYTNGLSTFVGGRQPTGEESIGFVVRLDGFGNLANWVFIPANQYQPRGRWNFGPAKWELVYISSLQDLEGIPIETPVAKGPPPE